MNKGFASKVLETKDRERYTRLLNNARTQAQAVQADLPRLDKEARAEKTGEADVGLGITYHGFAQYDKSVEALQRALQKGAGKRKDEAQIALGRAYLKLNQKDAARKAFKAVPDDSKLRAGRRALRDLRFPVLSAEIAEQHGCGVKPRARLSHGPQRMVARRDLPGWHEFRR